MVPGQPASRQLPPGDSVARHCRPRALLPDGRPARVAFMLRPGEEYISANWLEYFHQSDRDVQIDRVRRALAGKGFQLRRGARFAVLNAGIAAAAGRDTLGITLRFVALGETADPSHCGIYGATPQNNAAVAALLAALVPAGQMYPARL